MAQLFDPMAVMGMVGTYEARLVGRWEAEDKTGIVSTCAVSDCDDPYETAISTPLFNDGAWVVVEYYKDREEAVKGHERWVGKLSETWREKPPATVYSVQHQEWLVRRAQ